MANSLLNIAETKIGQVLQSFGNEMQRKLRENLQRKDAIVTSELQASVKFTAKIFGSQFVFSLFLADYYDFINQGVNGYDRHRGSDYTFKKNTKLPFRSAFDWMNNKGLFVPKGATVSSIASRKTFKAGDKKSQAFAMARSWKMNGIEGNHFYDEVVTDQRLNDLRRDLARATTEDVLVFVNRLAFETFGNEALRGKGIRR